jgi:hypothetical protein
MRQMMRKGAPVATGSPPIVLKSIDLRRIRATADGLDIAPSLLIN